jgi:dihydroflavonol-4-reductase
MTRALVTGASGFVGWHVARALLARGYSVRCLTRGKPVPELAVEVVRGDLTDAASVANAMRDCHHVFHVAADYRLWAKDPQELYRNNVEGTKNVLAAAAALGTQRVIYTSTVGCIGMDSSTNSNEASPVSLDDMTGHYKRSKFLAEQEALRAAQQGLPVVIVNPTAPIGGHDFKPTPTGRMVVDFLKGRMPAYIDTGLNVVDVRDVASGHLLAAERGVPGQRYILGSENLTLRQILELLARITGRRGPLMAIPHPIAWLAGAVSTGLAELTGKDPAVPLEAVRMAKKRMWVSHVKAQQELGFQPGPARAALEEACQWFLQQGYAA